MSMSLIDGHPHPEAIRAAMDRLEKVATAAGHPIVEMNEGRIMRHACGTSACHGGWYVIAKMEEMDIAWSDQIAISYEVPVRPSTVLPNTMNAITFDEGADLLARDLGFRLSFHLRDWADMYPDLWGNIHGSAMFIAGYAFGIEGRSPTTRDIINHWRGVADRIEATMKDA